MFVIYKFPLISYTFHRHCNIYRNSYALSYTLENTLSLYSNLISGQDRFPILTDLQRLYNSVIARISLSTHDHSRQQTARNWPVHTLAELSARAARWQERRLRDTSRPVRDKSYQWICGCGSAVMKTGSTESYLLVFRIKESLWWLTLKCYTFINSFILLINFKYIIGSPIKRKTS